MNGTKKSVGAITVLLAVCGGVVLVGTGAAATIGGVQQATATPGGSTQADARGVTSLDLEVDAADVTVEFRDDITSAQLRIEKGTERDWSLTRDRDELIVRGPGNGFDWFRPSWLRGDQRATLELPASLHGIDADLTLQAGSLRVDGEFGELDLDLNAGSLTVGGSATELDAEVNAGRADIVLRDVRTAEYTVNAGRITSELRAVPDEVSIDVSAGRLDLTVPDTTYAVRHSQAAGSLNSDLSQDPSSSHRIQVDVSAGSVTLEPGDRAE
ncbi:DUF4097 family beta strand repeat-containing protein [Microbacterium sp. ARD32]|uniref:DUF4097 family beta strand repeat-containing protein n=1 Tax=Microbacterium sp. ARD32 TaxID=2962577 RepID=UPI0028821FA8|nr:DUF4097 family beta strand repeat-containing protein [Microbacterium sp. ARD32]MDT0157809.1 DUF4097 family beta strand repeat-containing protein [Microbacterium sp. ARD32]